MRAWDWKQKTDAANWRNIQQAASLQQRGSHSNGSNAILMFTNCPNIISFSLGCRKWWKAVVHTLLDTFLIILYVFITQLPFGEGREVGKISWDNPQTESTMRGKLELGRLQLTNMFHSDRDSGRSASPIIDWALCSPPSKTQSIKSIRLNPVSVIDITYTLSC